MSLDLLYLDFPDFWSFLAFCFSFFALGFAAVTIIWQVREAKKK